MKLPTMLLYLLIGFLTLLLLPIPSYAQNIIDTERAREKVLLKKRDELEKAKEDLSASTNKKDESGEKTNQETVARLTRELEELSQQIYYMPSESGLARAEAFKVLIEDSYDQLVQSAKDEKDNDKRNQAIVERDALRKLIEDRAKTLDEQAKLDNALDTRFRGFGFGIALGAVIDMGGRDRIESAILDPTGKVRVEKDSNIRANFMLESHYFFQPPWDFPLGFLEPITKKLGWVEKGNWGFGPFVAV